MSPHVSIIWSPHHQHMFIVPITCLISLCPPSPHTQGTHPSVISPIRRLSHWSGWITLAPSPFTLFQDFYFLLLLRIASCHFIASLPPTRLPHIPTSLPTPPTSTFTSPSELFMWLISRSLENSNDAIPSKHFFR